MGLHIAPAGGEQRGRGAAIDGRAERVEGAIAFAQPVQDGAAPRAWGRSRWGGGGGARCGGGGAGEGSRWVCVTRMWLTVSPDNPASRAATWAASSGPGSITATVP